MSWAALAAKSKDVPVPTSTPLQVVRSKEDHQQVKIRRDDPDEKHVDPTEEAPAAVEAPEPDTANEGVENHPTRKILVLDTGALIKGSAGLPNKADEFTSIADVITEVRDQKTREFVEAFPFEIVLREPGKDAMREVIRVAKGTGDFGALSAVDLRVLGLAYTISKSRGALAPPPAALTQTGNFRKKPKVNYSCKPHGKEKQGGEKLPGWGSWDDKEDDEAEEEEEEDEEEEDEEEEKDDCVMRVEQGEETEVPEEEAHAPPQEEGREGPAAAEGEGEGEGEGADPAQPSAGADGKEEEVEEEGGWITPANIKKYNADAYTKFSDDTDNRHVGCMTTDFAMQNVLLHLGVLVVSVEGYRVKHLKKWVLRCHGCSCIVKDTTRQFCPDCGSGDTLKRVSYTINDKGEEEIWINPRRRVNVRGTVYNLPKPRGGRNGTNKRLVVREDQLQNCGKKSRAEQQKEDLVASLLSDDWMFAGDTRDKKSSNHGRPTKSSYTRGNPNQGRRRKL